MLVLSRKIGESVTIEGVGTITVRRCTDNGCKLAFDVPESINIARTELLSDGIERTELSKPIRDEMESILKRKGLVVEQPEHGSSQDDARMDCEGHEAPLYSSTPANKKTIDRLRAFAESLQRANKESDVGLDSIRELPQIHW